MQSVSFEFSSRKIKTFFVVVKIFRTAEKYFCRIYPRPPLKVHLRGGGLGAGGAKNIPPQKILVYLRKFVYLYKKFMNIIEVRTSWEDSESAFYKRVENNSHELVPFMRTAIVKTCRKSNESDEEFIQRTQEVVDRQQMILHRKFDQVMSIYPPSIERIIIS